MTSPRLFRFLPWLSALLLGWACQQEPSVAPRPQGEAPTGLAYAPARLQVEAGTPGQSGVPTVRGTAPISYRLSTVPASLGLISIDAQGVVSAHATLPEGTYLVSITASNASGATHFADVFTVAAVRTLWPPSALRYTPNALQIAQGTAAQSAAPTINGSSPFSFALGASPAHPGIAINPQTGVISVSAQVPVGTYSISVEATNPAGSAAFANAYALTVLAAGSSIITFSNHVQPLLAGNCGGCHSSFTTYATAAGRINSILGRVQLFPGSPGFMPRGGAPLSAAEISLLQQWQAQGLQP